MTRPHIEILTPVDYCKELQLCIIRRADTNVDTKACVNAAIHAVHPGLQLSHDEHGAPYLTGSPFHISISHCTSHVAVSLHPSMRHGVDAELPRQQLLRIKERFMTSAELAHYRTLPQLLWAWTVKEAVYKAAAWPGLPLRHIMLPMPGASCATLPDGRRFRITSFLHHEARITLAIPVQYF